MPAGVMDTSPLGTGNNWVTKSGGLHPYLRAIAHALIRAGHSESSAIAIAVGQCKNWAAGGGNVTAETRAKAAEAVADFEAKRGAAHLTADDDTAVDLAVAWDESQHPRQGGKFAPKGTTSTSAAKKSAQNPNALPPNLLHLAVPVASEGDGSLMTKIAPTGGKSPAAKPAPKMSIGQHMAALRKLAAAHKRAGPSLRPKIRAAMHAHGQAIAAARKG